MTGPFLAIDWGTSSRRIFRIEDGQTVAEERDARGAATLTASDYPGEVAAIRDRLGDLPMLLAGMAGAEIGWRKVPYVEAPAALEDLASSLAWIDERTAIIPGVCWSHGEHADVMRGEEVQLLGAVDAGMLPPDAHLCQPGTHCKWVEMKAGVIVRFTTAMTGELFALLSKHGLLARQLSGPVELGSAFLSGVGEGARRDLPASLFSVRARGLLGRLDNGDAASFASGMLIGADVAARVEPGSVIDIVADPELGAFYAAAIERLGGAYRLVDSKAAFVAGISHLWELTS